MKTFNEFSNESKKPAKREVDEMAIRHADTAADHLDDELSLIEGDDALVAFITEYLDKKVPDYFWTTAGAKKAGHHPAQDYGEGGLIRHTRMCVRVAEELLKNDLFAEVSDKKNELIAALICHDTKKNGNENDRYAFDHPTHAANSMKKFYREDYQGEKSSKLEGQIEFIGKCIAAHMGQWNTGFGKDKNVKLPLPNDPYCAFVHLCDYIASRMFIGNLDYLKKK